MKQTRAGVEFFIEVAKTYAVMSRRFDARLGGLGWSEFIIMFHLNQAEEGKMRRTDLAEKMGLTPSGITRLLLPMEKIGYIKRQADARDARVSYVALRTSGRELFQEGMERAEILVEEVLGKDTHASLETFTKTLKSIS